MYGHNASLSPAPVCYQSHFSLLSSRAAATLVAGFSLASMLSVFVSSPFSGEALFKDFHFPLFNRLVQRRLLFLCFLSPVCQSFVSLYYLMQRCSPLRDVILKSFIMLCYHLVCCQRFISLGYLFQRYLKAFFYCYHLGQQWLWFLYFFRLYIIVLFLFITWCSGVLLSGTLIKEFHVSLLSSSTTVTCFFGFFLRCVISVSFLSVTALLLKTFASLRVNIQCNGDLFLWSLAEASLLLHSSLFSGASMFTSPGRNLTGSSDGPKFVPP